jgi:hypothetical protein
MRFCLLLTALAVAGCSSGIGGGCTTNVDCSRLGDRSCDTSAPGGYCTVEGCADSTTCPDNSVCVRFLTANLTKACNLDQTFPLNGCAVDERCLCDQSNAQGVCVSGTAHCAPESTERRFCMYPCSSDANCRDLYQCRTTGTLGAEVVPFTYDMMTPSSVSFCAPRTS